MKKLFEKAYTERKKGRKIGLIVALSSVAFVAVVLISLFIYSTTDSALNYHLHNLNRKIVLINGLTFDIQPAYKREKLCVHLTVSHGFARLNDDENYDIHPVDKDGFDVASIKFYNTDFGYDFDAYKCSTVDKNNLYAIDKFKMRYPAWVEDN